MDRKSIFILVICFVLLMFWRQVVDKIYPPVKVPPHAASTNQVPGSTNGLATGTNQLESPTTGTNPAVVTGGSNAAPKFVVSWKVPEELLVVTNESARYTFTSRGGGLKEIELLHSPATVSTRRQKAQHTNEMVKLNDPLGPPIFAILGDESVQGDGYFKLTRSNGVVHAEKSLTNGLVVSKDFQFSSNYLVSASIKLENRSKQPLTLSAQEWVIGTATPTGPQDNGQGETVIWYNGSKTESVSLPYFDTNTTRMFVFSRTPQTEYRAGSNNVVWASAQNQFFALVNMPQKPAPEIVVRMVGLQPPSQEEIQSSSRIVPNPKGLQAAFAFPAEVLAPGQAVESQFNLYGGPKEYQVLASLSARFRNDIDQIMSFGFFGFISKLLLVTMDWLHDTLGLSYGLIIILITAVIKFIFWPLTAASTRSMKRMQLLQPQLKALQEKYKDEPQKLSAKQWEFYKKNKVNPLGGCLPMLLQIPVFFGFFGMLRNAIELRGAHFLWIGDLSQPDTVFVIPGINFPVNPMPLIMAASQFWQASMTPPSPSMDPGQQKIMKYMPLLMVYFLYNYPSGLALYWTVSNLLTILQTRLTKTNPDAAAVVAKAPASVAPQKKKK
ncbi:MAG: Membrane protein insertase YidC [Pedosphaera sp.]|nr:Membrane protein insertase YidC [Pedosphaera sp.]